MPILGVNSNVRATNIPGASAVATDPEVRAASRLRERELADFDATLSHLRQSLERLQDTGIERRRDGSDASVSSTSSLGLSQSDTTSTISSVGALSGISTGNFTINGVSIAVDVSTDSLQDVITRINAAGADVTAGLSGDYDSVTIRPNSPFQDLVIADDTSAFFTGTNITTGTFQPTPVDDRLASESLVRRLVSSIREDLNEIFSVEYEILSPDLLEAVRDGLKEVIQGSFSSLLSATNVDELESNYGIAFDFGDSRGQVFDLNFALFASTAERDRESLQDFLFRSPTNQTPNGLVSGLIAKLDEFGATPVEQIAPDALPGFFVQLRA